MVASANRYDRHLPYNDLPLLPPDVRKIETIEVLKALNNANKALAELKGLARSLPNQAMLVNTITLREAKASSEIENIFTTNDELYKAITFHDQEPKGNAKEVMRYRQALWKGYQYITVKKSFTIQSLIGIYQEIKQVHDGIRPSYNETVILKGGIGLNTREVVYTPPRGESLIEHKLLNMIEYLGDDVRWPDDPLIKIAISHYQFEAIHPFRDGNGRTGRIMSILLMIIKNLLDVPILYLSAYIIREKEEYYRLLSDVTTLRKWDSWIIYMLKAIEETSKYTIHKIEEINNLFEKTVNHINKHQPSVKKEFIEYIFEQPYISPGRMHEHKGMSLNTIKKYLRQLESMGILVSQKQGKEVIYLHVDLFNLLSET